MLSNALHFHHNAYSVISCRHYHRYADYLLQAFHMLHRESFPLDSHAHIHTSVYSLKSPTVIPNSHYGSGCISLRWLSKLSNVKAPSTLSTIFPFASINNVLGIGPTLYASITSFFVSCGIGKVSSCLSIKRSMTISVASRLTAMISTPFS